MRIAAILVTSAAIVFGGAWRARAQDTPDPGAVERIRAARSARVDFSGVSGPGMVTASLPLQTATEKLLGYGGLRLERQAPDLIVSITFVTQAVRQTHNRQVFGAPIGTMELVVRYTRAIVNGSIEFRPGSGPSVFARFNGAAAVINALGDREERVRSAAHSALVSMKEAASEPLLAT